MTNLYKKKH